MMHLEFVVLGPPISNQSPEANLLAWKAAVEKEAKAHWNKPILTGKLKGIIIDFHLQDDPDLDLENMS